jgi:hypothetical protein
MIGHFQAVEEQPRPVRVQDGDGGETEAEDEEETAKDNIVRDWA